MTSTSAPRHPIEEHGSGDAVPAVSGPQGEETAPVPSLRRDAARNRDKILAAARLAFDEEGFDVGVEVIAHRAGVGVGTLYRRFPTKELLIDSVVVEVLQDVLSAAEQALDEESASAGLATYLRAVGWLQFQHSGCLARLWNDFHDDIRGKIEVATTELLCRAQQAGSVRKDLVYEDVIVLFWSLRGVIEATSTVSSDAWLRHLDLLLSSLVPTGEALKNPPLTPGQVRQAKAALAARGAVAPAPPTA
jgi:AcrR family transcriptional regulator